MITTQFFIKAYDSITMKVIYIRLEDKCIILLANLDVRLGIFISIYIYELHTEGISGCRWNNHGWMMILH